MPGFWSVEVVDQITSTQDYIRENLDHLQEGAVVQALVQTSGRGRHGRIWESPEGNLYCSFLLKAPEDRRNIGQIALVCGLAMARCLTPYIRVTLKWPNDILIEGRKCCGILIETAGDMMIIGVGLNVLHAPSKEAAQLCAYCNPPDLTILRDEFLRHFKALYDEYQTFGFDKIREKWMRSGFPPGTPMSVKTQSKKISGLYQGLDKAGHLLLACDTSKETITVRSGDVFIDHAACD